MLKKQKRKRIRQKGKPGQAATDAAMQLIAHPFNGMNPEDLKAALVAYAAKQSEEFPKLLQEIFALLKRKYPPLLIAIVASYSLQAGVTDEGEIQTFDTEIMQHHVEVLQALALTMTAEEWGTDPPTGKDVAAVMKTLKALADAFHARRFGALEKEQDEHARAVLSMQEKLRIHTQAVRNWGSFSQVVRITAELYAPLDDALRAQKGFSATDLIVTARHMVEMLEERTSAGFRWMHRVFREHKPRKIVQAYFKHHPEMKGGPDDFLRELPAGATREQILFFLMQHADLLAQDTMMFDPAEMADRTGIPTDVTGRILGALALKPGDLKADDPEYFFMGNPIWEHPVILLDTGYFCVMPQAIFSHIHRILHRLCAEAKILPALEARRPKYLEDKVAGVLASAFPGATVKNGVKWRAGAVEYETDHLVIVDKVALIVEDKSHALTERGLRGAPERVREHVRNLIGAPSEQSARLEAVIWRVKGMDAEAIATLAPFGIDFAGVERVVRINVTLDDLTVLAGEETELKAAGWISNDVMLAPTMTLADLEAVVDILERQAFLLHYFAERQRVQTEGRVMADEIDLLSVYLKNGLNMGDLNAQKLELTLTGASAPVDDYYNKTDAGIDAAKPKPLLSPYYAKLIAAMENKAFGGWSLATADVLRSGTYAEQLNIEKALAKLKATVDRNRDEPLKECCLVVQSHPLKDTAVVFLAYPPSLAARRREITNDMGGQILEARADLNRVVIVSRDTSRWHDPYASVFFLVRPDKPTA